MNLERLSLTDKWVFDLRCRSLFGRAELLFEGPM